MTLRIVIACVLLSSIAVHADVPQGAPPPPPQPAQTRPARDVPFRAPEGGASISGRVMSADQTPRPIRRAIVTLKSDAYRTGWTVVADDNGAFTVRGLPAGRYLLGAVKAGFVTSAYGALRPGRPGSPIAVAENARVANLTMTMLRGAVITGVVRDSTGGPMEGVQVTAALIAMRNSARTASPLASFSTTDDRGEYRVFGLAPGEYAVSIESRALGPSASAGYRRSTPAEIDAALAAEAAGAPAAVTRPSDTQDLTLSGVYYPGTARLDDAELVKVAAGEERRGVDIQLEYVPAVTIEGRILDPDGKPPLNITLNLYPTTGARSQFGRPSPADGTFTFPAVVPGRYHITARATSTTASGGVTATLYARAEVDVTGSPIKNVNLTLKEGVTVSGSLSFDSATGGAPSSARVSLTQVLAPGEISLGVPLPTTAANGMFSFAGMTPGKYRVTASTSLGSVTGAPSGWTLKSATAEGKDAIDDGFDVGDVDVTSLAVTLSDRIAEIAGSLEDASGRPAPDYYVVVFPTDSRFWIQNSRRITTARPGVDGKFTIRGLPPGEYRIAAVTDVETGEWFEPTFLQQLVAASTPLTLTEGEKKSFPLKLGGG